MTHSIRFRTDPLAGFDPTTVTVTHTSTTTGKRGAGPVQNFEICMRQLQLDDSKFYNFSRPDLVRLANCLTYLLGATK